MFCRECGKMIQEGAKFCTGCGAKVVPINNISKIENNNVENNEKIEVNDNNVIKETVSEKIEDKNSIGMNILAFFIPVVGLILFLCWRERFPKKSKNIGICALIGYILRIFASLVVSIWLFTAYIPKYVQYDDYNDNDNFFYKYEDYYMKDRHDI